MEKGGELSKVEDMTRKLADNASYSISCLKLKTIHRYCFKWYLNMAALTWNISHTLDQHANMANARQLPSFSIFVLFCGVSSKV